ncbi:hypothetical protein FB45DRAFT_865752 [Roridomyces roridus]|uniref:Uncharacterized protein n=1 Tax=Roridomyces roridus TaxID=1738132 RepID=A0AAD7C009_9AGAR|nr:hypothetical protein FB45DRAFT_865752 [Roridomyces roridus]
MKKKRKPTTQHSALEELLRNVGGGIVITRALNNSSTEPVDMSPLLSTATLSAIAEGTPHNSNNIVLIPILAVFGCKTEDLGDEFVEITTRMMLMTFAMNKTALLLSAVGNRLPRWALKLFTLFPSPALNELRKGVYLSRLIGHRLAQEKLSTARQGIEPNNDSES